MPAPIPLLNRTDSSTTSGFSDLGEGTTWATEAQFQYRIGDLPGGQNVGFAYSFDNDFLNLKCLHYVSGRTGTTWVD